MAGASCRPRCLAFIWSRPICSISPAAFITRSTLICGTSGVLAKVSSQVLLRSGFDPKPFADKVSHGFSFKLQRAIQVLACPATIWD